MGTHAGSAVIRHAESSLRKATTGVAFRLVAVTGGVVTNVNCPFDAGGAAARGNGPSTPSRSCPCARHARHGYVNVTKVARSRGRRGIANGCQPIQAALVLQAALPFLGDRRRRLCYRVPPYPLMAGVGNWLDDPRTVSDPAPPAGADEPRKGRVNGVRGS